MCQKPRYLPSCHLYGRRNNFESAIWLVGSVDIFYLTFILRWLLWFLRDLVFFLSARLRTLSIYILTRIRMCMTHRTFSNLPTGLRISLLFLISEFKTTTKKVNWRKKRKKKRFWDLWLIISRVKREPFQTGCYLSNGRFREMPLEKGKVRYSTGRNWVKVKARSKCYTDEGFK